MKKRSLLAILLTFLSAAVVLGAGPQDEEHSELEEHMERIEGAVKSLRRSLRDPANLEQSLALVTDIQAATIAAKGLTPHMAESVPEAERAAFVGAYRGMMLDFLDHQIVLERALLAGDEEAVTAAFKEVRDMEDTGHERFTKEEE